MTTLPTVIEAGSRIEPIVPRNMAEILQCANEVIQAGLVPDSYKGRTDAETRSKVAIGIQKGLEVGFPPLAALSTIMIVNNRPSLWGDALPALVQRSGKMTHMREWFEGDAGKESRRAYCELGRVGMETKTTRSFSLDEAKRIGLWPKKGPWMQYPDRMLQMRARAWAFRDLFADCLMGLSVAEEVQDLPMRDVTPNPGAALDDEPATITESEVVPNTEVDTGTPPDDTTPAPQVVGPSRPVIEDTQDLWLFEIGEREAAKGMAALEAWFKMQPPATKAAIKPHLEWLKRQAETADATQA